jgi:hypothetical protein
MAGGIMAAGIMAGGIMAGGIMAGGVAGRPWRWAPLSVHTSKVISYLR